MTRGGYRGKVKRGGGRSFSRSLKPLTDEDFREEKSGSSSESSEESEESSSEDDTGPHGEPVVSIGPSLDDSSKEKSAPMAIENANRTQKAVMKASELGKTESVELSRREREEMEKRRAKEAYWKLHEAGKTDQARADLARLTLVRKEREEKARQRIAEAERKKEEASAKAEREGRRK